MAITKIDILQYEVFYKKYNFHYINDLDIQCSGIKEINLLDVISFERLENPAIECENSLTYVVTKIDNFYIERNFTLFSQEVRKARIFYNRGYTVEDVSEKEMNEDLKEALKAKPKIRYNFLK